jgi:hypothetical protein
MKDFLLNMNLMAHSEVRLAPKAVVLQERN